MKKSILVLISTVLVVLSACGTSPEIPQNPSTQNTSAGITSQLGTAISEEQAKQAALNHAGLAENAVTFSKVYLDRDDAKYEIEFYDQATRKSYDYDINTTTGDIISYEHKDNGAPTSPAGSNINADQAKKIALDKVPGSANSNIVEFKEDLENSKKVYEGKIIFKNTEYEFEISAETGTVLKWESESVYS